MKNHMNHLSGLTIFSNLHSVEIIAFLLVFMMYGKKDMVKREEILQQIS